jgi:selenocysteine-specific elongation factor
MRDIILGTAGHVDHGKTALIEALTGYNGDEMVQEKERGITIDLSFSNMRRGDVNVAFIDVPGHDKLVKNMVSGAFGFDAALLVIDAGEGIMPQTREHLAVLDIVGVRQLVVALTKSDLVYDAQIAHQKQDIEVLLEEHYPQMESVAILPTSIHEPETIDVLKEVLFHLPPRSTPDAPFFRYYIDRVFSPRGVGTVVTGTVLAGSVHKGDKLNIAELAKPTTVRGIQVHGEPVEQAHTHQRVALNLDIPHTRLAKGYLLASKGYFRGFATLDVVLRILDDHTLTHEAEVLFITGSKRVEGRVLLDEGSDFATLKLRDKVFTRFGDPFVLLLAGRVVAGGEILGPISDPIRKRRKRPLLHALHGHDFATAFSILLANHRRGFGLISSHQRFGLDHTAAITVAQTLEGVFVDEKGLVVYPLDALQTLRTMLETLYEKNPRALLSPASVTLRAKWASEALVAHVMEQMVSEGALRKERGVYLRADQAFDGLEQELEERIYRILDDEGLTPEAPYNLYDRLDLDRRLGDGVFKSLTARRKVIRLAHNLFVTETNLTQALSTMREIIAAQGYIDIRNFKKSTGMSRKYCIAYLEFLDKSGEVVKEGEKRVLRYQ